MGQYLTKPTYNHYPQFKNKLNADYLDHANGLFIKLYILKFRDLVEFKTVQTVYKARRNNLLPGNKQRPFTDREGDYYHRGTIKMKKHFTQTNLKSMCILHIGLLEFFKENI